jgi:hypothetical protein
MQSFVSLLNIVKVIKLWMIRWAGHVAHMGDKRKACKTLVRDLGKRAHFEDAGRDGTIIFKLMLKKQNGRSLTRLIWLRTGTRDWLL